MIVFLFKSMCHFTTDAYKDTKAKIWLNHEASKVLVYSNLRALWVFLYFGMSNYIFVYLWFHSTTRYVAPPRNAVLMALPSVQVAEPPRSHCVAEPRNENKIF